MNAKLVYQDLTNRTQHLLLTKEEMTLGRDPACSLPIEHGTVSVRHCHIIQQGGQWFIEDLKSTNGTLVNRQKIHGRVRLNHQDVIGCGPLQLQFVLVAPSDQVTLLPAEAQSRLVAERERALEERDKAVQERDQAVQERADASAQRQQAEATIEGLRKQVATLTEDAERDRRKLEDVDQRRLVAEAEARRSRGELDKLREEQSGLRRQVEALQGEQRGTRESQVKLVSEVEGLRDRLAKEMHLCGDLKLQVELKERATQRSTAEIEQLRGKLRDSERAAEGLSLDLRKQQQDRTDWHKVNQDNARLLQERKATIEELQGRLNALEAQAEEWHKLPDQYTEELARLRKNNDTKNVRLQGLQESVNRLEEKLRLQDEAAARERERALRQGGELRKNLEEARLQIARLQLQPQGSAPKDRPADGEVRAVVVSVHGETQKELDALQDELLRVRRLSRQLAERLSDEARGAEIEEALGLALGRTARALTRLGELRPLMG